MSTQRIRLTTESLEKIEPQAKLIRVWDDEIDGFLAQVTPKGKISFYIGYRHGGKKRWYSIPPEYRRMSAIRKEAKRCAGLTGPASVYG